MVDIDGSCEKINNTTCHHLQVVIGILRNLKEVEMAESVGFEPTLELPLNTLSKRAPSATRPQFHQYTTNKSEDKRTLNMN